MHTYYVNYRYCDNLAIMIIPISLSPNNNLEQMLTFKHSLFSHFAHETNEIWYPGRTVNGPPRFSLFPVYMYM